MYVCEGRCSCMCVRVGVHGCVRVDVHVFARVDVHVCVRVGILVCVLGWELMYVC